MYPSKDTPIEELIDLAFHTWRNRDFLTSLRNAETWKHQRNLILIMGYHVGETERDVQDFIRNLSRASYPGRSSGFGCPHGE